MFFGKLSPFENLGIGRIGHDTRKFDDILTGFGQDLHDFIVNPGPLNGPAAIGTMTVFPYWDKRFGKY